MARTESSQWIKKRGKLDRPKVDRWKKETKKQANYSKELQSNTKEMTEKKTFENCKVNVNIQNKLHGTVFL